MSGGLDDEGMVGVEVADADADAAGEGIFEEVAADLSAPAGEEAGEGVGVTTAEMPVDQAAEVAGGADKAGGDFALDADGLEQGFHHEREHAGLVGGAAALGAAGVREVAGGEFAGGAEGVEEAIAVAIGEAVEAADAAQVIVGDGGGLGDGHDEVVAEDALAGEVALFGEVFAPDVELANGGEFATAELLRAGDAPPAILGEFIQELGVAPGEFLVEPAGRRRRRRRVGGR